MDAKQIIKQALTMAEKMYIDAESETLQKHEYHIKLLEERIHELCYYLNNAEEALRDKA